MTTTRLGDEASVGRSATGGFPPPLVADRAARLVRFYQRRISPHTKPCRTRLAGGRSCSTRMADALIRHGLLTGLVVAAPQVWACCGNSHSQTPASARPRYSPHGGTVTRAGRRT